MSHGARGPGISIVVTLVSGRTADLDRCLAALVGQQAAPTIEILVPYDEACADVAALGHRFPEVRFIRAAGLDTVAARRGASREHHDTLRTIGLRAATGQIIVLTEDHAHTHPAWCAAMAAALRRYPTAAAVGGAVECDSDRALNWAVWFCDFCRYQNPVPEGPSAFVSDANVAYRRAALEQVSAAWAGDFHETAVHWAMLDAGFDICLTRDAIVWQRRGDLPLRAALRERYVWGRSFAGTRARLTGTPRRIVYAALSPLLPVVLTARIARTTLARKRHCRRLLGALPLIAVLQAAWAFGEFVGYVRGRP